MASLPTDRTKLALAQGNQVPSAVIASAKNINSITEAYDTIDMLYNYINSFVTSGTLSPIPPDFLYRQAIINPFEVWQRGTSFSSTGYGPDRWYADLSIATLSKVNVNYPIGSQSNARVTMTGTGFGNIYHAFESSACKKYAGKTMNFSVKLRRNTAFASGIKISIGKNATPDTLLGGTWSLINEVTITNTDLPTGTTATDWVTYSVSAFIPLDGSAQGIRLTIEMLSPAGAGGYYEVAQPGVNEGASVLPFQPVDFPVMLQQCQRFYEKSFNMADAPANNIGYSGFQSPCNDAGFGNSYCAPVFFKVRKRTSLYTVSFYNPNAATAGTWQWFTGAAGTSLAPTTEYKTEHGFGALRNAAAYSYVQGHWVVDDEL